MGRSRSRSRERGRRGSASPERWSKRGGDDDDWKREAERREEARKRWSVSPERKGGKGYKKTDEEAGKPAAPVYEPGSMEAQMAALGLPVEGFASTKNQHVEGNDDFVVADVPIKRKHRQYMNKRVTKSVKVPVRR